MNQLCRQTMVAAALAVLGSVSSSAWADSYTIDFKTFFNTATADNPFDTKTLNFSVATLTISYYDIGYKTGEMAYDILVNGADPATMPIEYAPQFTPKYNPTICEELGIQPLDGYEAIEG